MQPVAEFFKEENDFLYRKGFKKGVESVAIKAISNLIAQSGLSDEQIAGIAEVPLSFVKSIRDELKNC